MNEIDGKSDQLRDEIDGLVSEIEDINSTLYDLAQNSTSGGKIKTDRVDWALVDQVDEQYEVWYNRGLTLVSEYLPEREADFRGAYSDMDELLHFDGMEYKKADRYCGILRRIISRQKNILLSIPSKLETERLKVRKGISDEILTEELYQAKDLWDAGNIRAAGVVTGVALERHLLTLCEVSERDLEYRHSDGIRSLAETLYDAGEITDTTKSQLGYLADIRNDCAHANEKEPDRRDVERLIKQAEDIVREV
ncbi:DUF4145 domain-containing protein [Halorussus sp. MSC15.2]|uniref:DUF4145 domain-containing protein n=1 Tax=Halorussus sp. MSC15.2 TaxID=2283638 RepID=UPI0013D008DB|nr:DUF4145 domain-containing protein [Halorussus sp. MSC15.2]NEU55561.1 DUF4145 domain-containing protein [Halorussus sp. MSC15.2]